MTITATLKKSLKSLLLKYQLRLCRATDFDPLARFFDVVKPILTNHRLIRLGGQMDGGYLIPDDLVGIEACFSPGVSSRSDFEHDLANRGIKCFLADYSVDAPTVQNELFNFEKRYLGPIADSTHMTLESWVRRLAPNQHDLILQMDIEGGEYGVIFDTSRETLRKFRILAIEFHELESLLDKFGFELIDLTFKKLLTDFDVVHIHPNNYTTPVVYGKYEIPPAMEFTFLRKDRISTRLPALTFPHELDRRNVPQNEDYPLPKCWYGD
jgi:hypothetical protein